jgi:hypothetical protein
MSIRHRLIPSTHGARRRALILVLYVVILGAGFSLQAYQNRSDTVYVFVRGGIAYVQTMSDGLTQAVFPLADECGIRWTNGKEGAFVAQTQMDYPVDTGTLPAGSTAILHFATRGDISLIQGAPWVTLRSKLGDVRLMADCPPPAPTTHHVYVYVLGEHLFLYDTLNEQLVLLMPLRELLLWSGDVSYIFGMDMLVTRDQDRAGYAWLPEGATVLGDFETANEISLKNLDETQVQIRYGSHELMLVSYDRWAR